MLLRHFPAVRPHTPAPCCCCCCQCCVSTEARKQFFGTIRNSQRKSSARRNKSWLASSTEPSAELHFCVSPNLYVRFLLGKTIIKLGMKTTPMRKANEKQFSEIKFLSADVDLKDDEIMKKVLLIFLVVFAHSLVRLLQAKAMINQLHNYERLSSDEAPRRLCQKRKYFR